MRCGCLREAPSLNFLRMASRGPGPALDLMTDGAVIRHCVNKPALMASVPSCLCFTMLVNELVYLQGDRGVRRAGLRLNDLP
jgi:hypothetical protein